MSFAQSRRLLIAVVFAALAPAGWCAGADIAAAATLTADQIVSSMVHSNQSRAESLKHYQSQRHYQVEYKGFATTLGAKMDVDVNYDAPSTKEFRIVAQSGSKLLIDKVLKRLLDTEKESAKDHSSSALTPANYKFTLQGNEPLSGRQAYILGVEPIQDSKLLYRGKIWVDATDFAVVKIDAQPAKNPSFWIASTKINHTYVKTGGYWLPQQNRSETKVRIGGTAVLTIDYGTYNLGPEAQPVGATLGR